MPFIRYRVRYSVASHNMKQTASNEKVIGLHIWELKLIAILTLLPKPYYELSGWYTLDLIFELVLTQITHQCFCWRTGNPSRALRRQFLRFLFRGRWERKDCLDQWDWSLRKGLGLLSWCTIDSEASFPKLHLQLSHLIAELILRMVQASE